MSTMLSGSTNAFDIALETGATYYDMATGSFFRFDDYKYMKKLQAEVSGVFLTDDRSQICGLWEEKDVQKYIKDHGLNLTY